ncbi:hypothetical protein QRD40_10670 [Comamonas sp. Y6]|uniref:Transposase n=1 Tax=Comamonas resistens TaxID=3046670 RepID=A0ABY8SXW9_9BURK|nr:hypothetical protein [Comamonas resistens]MDL5036809.1 hypothetical protein [Comamonas resistens]WHS67119.1 hypothetical protein QMY55_08385 [Comamonas resistens]
MNPRSRQLPGRSLALRLVLSQGVNNSSPELRQLAGLTGKKMPRRPPAPDHGSVTFESDIEQLPKHERVTLPF